MDLSKIATFTNIDVDDFSHSYDGQTFFVAAGEAKVFPYSLADHLAKHLARKILLKGDKVIAMKDDQTGGLGHPIWSEEAEIELKRRILGEVQTQTVAPEPTEQEKVAAKVEELNTLTPVDPDTFISKKDVIAKLEAKGIPVDVRKTKDELLAQLNA